MLSFEVGHCSLAGHAQPHRVTVVAHFFHPHYIFLVCGRSAGPCERTAHMSGASAVDKKAFEASCSVQWPEMGGECAHDYGAPCRLLSLACCFATCARRVFGGFFLHGRWGLANCALASVISIRGPFAWYQTADECVAPLTCAKLRLRVVFACCFSFFLARLRYGVCSRRKSFATMTPAAKEDWVICLQAVRRGCLIRAVFVEARNCKVEFPCQGRLLNLLPPRLMPFGAAAGRELCTKAYSAPCPAEWFAFNGGMSCSAPSHYAGACLPVQLRSIIS